MLIFDEIDALEGDALRNVLSQIRLAYPSRPGRFPSSVILCGMKDVRDYKLASGSTAPVHAGSSSPFNIMEKSLRLPNFTQAEFLALYAQHVSETGQPFTEDALAHAWELTQGQPWLSNALAREVIVEMGVRPPEPIIAGELPYEDLLDDDYTYVRDLGLIALDDPPRFSNPIYEEVVLRVLSFWKENGEILAGRMSYPEAAPLLVMMAWLLRFTNGSKGPVDPSTGWRGAGAPVPEGRANPGAGGILEREIAVGSKRMDLLLRWPYTDTSGEHAWQREAFEVKVWRDRDKRRDPVPTGLTQLDGYLARLGQDHGTLVVFDTRASAEAIEDRSRIEETVTPSGRSVVLLRG